MRIDKIENIQSGDQRTSHAGRHRDQTVSKKNEKANFQINNLIHTLSFTYTCISHEICIYTHRISKDK